jgi:hypothetical protein
MNEEFQTLQRVTDALRWAIYYAELGHESMYPGETFEKDGYVAASVAEMRSALAEAEAYIGYVLRDIVAVREA